MSYTPTHEPTPDTPVVEDWQYEVANGDTVLGYAEWCEHQREAHTESPAAHEPGYAAGQYRLQRRLRKHPHTVILREWLGGSEVIDFDSPEGRTYFLTQVGDDDLYNRIVANDQHPIRGIAYTLVNEGDGEFIERYSIVKPS